MRIEIRGGRVHDPGNGVSGVARSVFVENGRIVEPQCPASFLPERVLDARGRVVLPGAIDIHCHIAGAAVNRARRLVQEAGSRAARGGGSPAWRAGTAGPVPSTFVTGYRYAALGYTAAVEAAVPPSGARQCHLELADTPCLDKAMLLVLSDHPLVLEAIATSDRPRLRELVSQFLADAGAFGIKAVNPGGAALWRRARGLIDGLDHEIGARGPTPRAIVRELAAVAEELELPHALHLHANRLGIPGNVETTIETLRALEGRAAHLAHVQFHAYGKPAAKAGTPLASGAEALLDALERYPQVTADVGQICFGEAVTITADRPVEHLLWQLTGRRWVNIDVELDSGCGIVPVEYRARSRVHAVQWLVGLELLLLSGDPWRLVLSTDHPNGASFVVYPRLIATLMDREFRRLELARLPADLLAASPVATLEREYTLDEIAIITRAAPARILGMRQKGHLGAGADADITVLDDDADRLHMFECPHAVLKGGRVIVEEGELRTPAPGTVFRAAVEPSKNAEREIAAWTRRHRTIDPQQRGLSADELAALPALSARTGPEDRVTPGEESP